jgi:nucleotide-binding universal stress UspA family protein
MSMKAILVPMENRDTMQSALQAAVLLARRHDSHIEGLALRWRLSELAGVDMMAGLPLDRYVRDTEEDAKHAQRLFESFMQDQGVPRSTRTVTSLSFNWLDDEKSDDRYVGSYGRVFDVIVMNRPDPETTGLYYRAIESGLFESGRPILLSPPTPPNRMGTNVVIAWNCSTEQARATALAMPILHKAERVTVLTVIGGTSVPGPSADQLVAYLQRNGINADLLTAEVNGKTTGEVILATAQSLECDLLIKGAYTQSRLRQMIFGGATQHVLTHAGMPVLLAN